MPLAEIAFFAQKKCYLSEQRRHFSGQNGVFVGRCRLCGGWGGRCLPFGWKFQSKTDITIRFGVSWQTAALTSTNESLGSDDSVFFLLLALLRGKDRKHYRLQVLPWGQEGAISGGAQLQLGHN